MSVIQCHPAGLRWLNFHADYKRSLKVCSLVTMNVPERGILCLTAEKISRPRSPWSFGSYFFSLRRTSLCFRHAGSSSSEQTSNCDYTH